MPIYKLENKKLNPVNEAKFDLEKDIQKITEENLGTVFGITFVSGSLNKEFSISTNDQDFYIDTLAFDESQKSFVIIEYKKDRSFSVIDQGFAYLSAMLSNQAEFVLELNDKLNKKYTKKDIDWEQSRIIFVSPEFTNYQKNAINFKDLPIFLYEVKLYQNNLVEFDAIKPYRTSVSINKITQDKIIQKVSKEIKVYNLEDLFKPDWTLTKELYELLREKILSLDPKIKEITTKYYVAYKLFKNGQWYNFVELLPQSNNLVVYLDTKIKEIEDRNKIMIDCSKVGHWATGNSKFKISRGEDIDYAFHLMKQVYEKNTE